MLGVHDRPDLSVPWVLPAGPSGVTVARQAARQALHELEVEDQATIDTVELLVSELTSNVVKHTGGRASLRLTRTNNVIRIEVCDAKPTQVPIERDVDVAAESGRGLLLVSTLATSWGYERSNQVKCTWAELDLEPLAAPRTSS